MIAFEDFVPTEIEAGGFLRAATLEDLQTALHRANDWIVQRQIDVIHVETVVLPNMHSRFEEGSQDTALNMSGEMRSIWYQFIRVWYRRD